MQLRRRLRLAGLVLAALLPGLLKRAAYRHVFGYRIGRRVRVGLSLLDAQAVDLGDDTVIGHLNLILQVGRLETGPHCRIGWLNIIRGGERVSLGACSSVMRLNVLNAIPDNDCTTAPVSVLEVGEGSVVVSGHRIDFTDRVRLGRDVILAGRNSSLWTHDRQTSAPIEIGDFCYLGSEVRLAPGAGLPDECILGLGSVLLRRIPASRTMVGGIPAVVVKNLQPADIDRLHRRTRGEGSPPTPASVP